MSTFLRSERPKKRQKPNDDDVNADEVLAKIDSKTKQIDELLAGYDNNALNFIPPSLNKASASSSSTNTKSSFTTNTTNSNVTKTITITATSFEVVHHTEDDQQTAVTPPVTYIAARDEAHTLSPEPLRPLPSPHAKPATSALQKSTFTSFRDEKRNKRRNKDKSDSNNSDESHDDRKRSISFDKTAKKEDGESAKFYSAPQYLIRDGTKLRPKPLEQIDNEKRLLQMLGAPKDLAGRALPPGLLDEDWNEIYDPQIPNDYTNFVNARHRLQEWIAMRREQRNIAHQKAMMAAQYAQEYIDNEIKREKEQEKASKKNTKRYKHRKRDRDRDRDRDRSRRSSNRDRDRRSRSRERERDRDRDRSRRSCNRIPTQSPLEAMHRNVFEEDHKSKVKSKQSEPQKLSGIDKAAKMMAKFGWKKGDGLGKSKQGLKGCLVPVGGYNQLMSVQDPTNVLLLQNMANKGQVDVHLKTETVEECKHFGPVLDCVVYETKKKNVVKEHQVSVFVKFEYIESCMSALQRFNGRFFDGRRVIASFFPLDRFDAHDLDP